MEKVSKFKLLKLPSFFTSSCKTQNLDEVIDHSKTPIFTLQKPLFTNEEEQQQQINEKYPLSNFVIKPRKSTSSSTLMTCKPRCPKTFDQMVRENCIIPNIGKSPETRRKVTGKYSMLSPYGYVPGRQCPPSSPASPLSRKQGSMYKEKKKKEKGKKTHFNYNKKSNNTPRYYNNKFNYSSNESDYDKDDCCFSSDDEKGANYYYDDDGKSTMFSLKSMSTFSSKSISFSSDESDEFQTRTQTRARARPRGHTRPRRRKTGSKGKEVEVMALEKKVKDTYAIVKSSSDPYNDFRTSMVEMIIEKQIFGAKELEQLLECFLSLNSSHHHRVILEVFSEICDALFS